MTVTVYIEYEPGKANDRFCVWVEVPNKLMVLPEYKIAGTYHTFSAAHKRLNEVTDNYKALGYRVKGR